MARSGDEVAAGDGLGAFGATLILPVRMHSRGSRTLAMQWIHEKLSSIEEPRLAENQDHQIWAELTRPPAAQLREKRWGLYGSYRRWPALRPPQPRENNSASVTFATHPGGGEEQSQHASARVGDRVAASPTRAALAPHGTIAPRCRGGDFSARDPIAGRASEI